MSLKINVRETPDAVILDMKGQITLGESLMDFRDTIREVLAGDQKNILLNLADVTYIDSSGLGQLVGSYATVTNAGGHLKLLNLQKRVNDLMQVTKLLSVFESYDSEGKAVHSFKAAT
ncbi:MAG TPA: STAS domain-containing protein [Bryobacteraceae bacterium]|nr:STAS domain-containing protein [Bryobacteraceae bacterium]